MEKVAERIDNSLVSSSFLYRFMTSAEGVKHMLSVGDPDVLSRNTTSGMAAATRSCTAGLIHPQASTMGRSNISAMNSGPPYRVPDGADPVASPASAWSGGLALAKAAGQSVGHRVIGGASGDISPRSPRLLRIMLCKSMPAGDADADARADP